MEKKWYKSKTIWSAIASAIIAGISAYFGEANQYVAIVIALASGLGIYGRIDAKGQIVS